MHWLTAFLTAIPADTVALRDLGRLAYASVLNQKTMWDHCRPGCTVQITSMKPVNSWYYYCFTDARTVSAGMSLMNVFFGQQPGVWCVCWTPIMDKLTGRTSDHC